MQQAATIEYRQSWSFRIAGHEMDHDEGVYKLEIEVSYFYTADILEGEYPDWRLIAADVKDFLASYPDRTHYWEVVNKRLAERIIGKYTILSSLTLSISIPPLASNSSQRITTVTVERRRAAP